MEEEWKPIENFPNYEVSNLGNIRNIFGKQLKLQKDNPGYLRVSLLDSDKKQYTCRVHRLVAIAFLPNIENKPTINHKNRIKSDNNVNNLEWASMSEQNQHVYKTTKILKQTTYKPIYRICKNNNIIIQKYNSITDASIWIMENNLTTIKDIKKICNISSKICAVARNNRKEAYGFKWEYVKVVDNINNNEIWKIIPNDIVNNDNFSVSNFGRIKNNNGIILLNDNPISGYYRIRINEKKYLLHRLIALTFLDNPHNKEFVNHIDGNKLNNNLENLEWATCLENNMHKINIGLSNCTKEIIQYDLDMNRINNFMSIVECSRALNIGVTSISNQCRGEKKTPTKGYFFRYANAT